MGTRDPHTPGTAKGRVRADRACAELVRQAPPSPGGPGNHIYLGAVSPNMRCEHMGSFKQKSCSVFTSSGHPFSAPAWNEDPHWVLHPGIRLLASSWVHPWNVHGMASLLQFYICHSGFTSLWLQVLTDAPLWLQLPLNNHFLLLGLQMNTTPHISISLILPIPA